MQQQEVARPAVATVRGALARDGWMKLSAMDDRGFESLAAALGGAIDDTPVRLVPGRRTYLTRPGAIPLHTDHPMADTIMWRCEAQDRRDGASLLVDGRSIVAALDAPMRAVLHRALLPAMVRLGDVPAATHVLSSISTDAALFFAPWLQPVDPNDEVRAALRALTLVIERAPRIAARLQPGEVLVVDNHRVLHGRGPLLADSARRLRRLWIRSHVPGAIPSLCLRSAAR